MTSFRKTILALTVISAIFAVVSCGSKYNNTKFKDPNEGNTHVYGVDSSALNGEIAPAEAAK
ncbi:MAG: hypothetical protein RL711_27 [Bacteroidota bacterium]|jgi:uncharacterized lipoprotein YehR (DUF1307 family)